VTSALDSIFLAPSAVILNVIVAVPSSLSPADAVLEQLIADKIAPILQPALLKTFVELKTATMAP
jgi:hypothetical protein